ncbi:MAG: PA0069 family radical SAM protein [Sinobacteraceae bacterium]|nr:PA0069 family radical SAM protein [Nevskiaceae bacterium]
MSQQFLGKKLLKGRGALSNPAGRFERTGIEAFDDGWYVEDGADSVETTLQPDTAKTVISTNDSPDIGFEYSINPYRGCSHGCVYCYARPSHAYMGLSPGRDFETRLFYKADAGKVLEAELARPSYVCKPIMLGANTDPYQPDERHMLVTRSVLEVLNRCRHPVSIVTKGALVVRDLDLLADLARENLVTVTVSITSLDAETKRTLEPRAASPAARLRAVNQLSKAGVPVGILVAPVIPALTDHEMERILEAAVEMGAKWAGYVMLRLPYEVKDLFREWLAEHHPQRAAHVMSLIQDVRGGRDNDPNFGSRMRGTGPVAQLIRSRFQIARRRLGLDGLGSLSAAHAPAPPPQALRSKLPSGGRQLDTTLFRAPGLAGAQLNLGF